MQEEPADIKRIDIFRTHNVLHITGKPVVFVFPDRLPQESIEAWLKKLLKLLIMLLDTQGNAFSKDLLFTSTPNEAPHGSQPAGLK